jgi:hypothetical protein
LVSLALKESLRSLVDACRCILNVYEYYLLEQDAILCLGSYSEESVAVSDCAALYINLVCSEDERIPDNLTDYSLSLLRRQTPVTATRVCTHLLQGTSTLV